jgi:hypothetical protein
MSQRNKFISFSYTIPIPSIKKDSGRLFIDKAGELLICAKARIIASLAETLLNPLREWNDEEVRITLESVHFNGVDILPVLQLPDARPLLTSINRAAMNNLINIHNQA